MKHLASLLFLSVVALGCGATFAEPHGFGGLTCGADVDCGSYCCPGQYQACGGISAAWPAGKCVADFPTDLSVEADAPKRVRSGAPKRSKP